MGGGKGAAKAEALRLHGPVVGSGCPPVGWGHGSSRLQVEMASSSRFAFLSLCVPDSLATADSTGTHSLYTTYQDHEIMFHVSTMLPYTPNNQQQV